MTESEAAAESVIERLYFAVEHLATGPGDARQRLQVVALTLAPLQAREFPIEVREDYKWVWSQLTRFPPQWDGQSEIEATMKRIRKSTGSKIAERIWLIYGRVQKIRGHPEPFE